MTEPTYSLLTCYKGWEAYQRGLIEMIAPLSPEQLAFSASREWTVGMIAQHMIGNRVWWFQVWMGEGSPDLAPIAHWDPQDIETRFTLSAPELIAGLESTWQMIAAALACWTPADLGQIFQPPASLREEERANTPPFSRQWIIWHVFEHEIHHGGEISLVLGNHQLDGVYGKR